MALVRSRGPMSNYHHGSCAKRVRQENRLDPCKESLGIGTIHVQSSPLGTEFISVKFAQGIRRDDIDQLILQDGKITFLIGLLREARSIQIYNHRLFT